MSESQLVVMQAHHIPDRVEWLNRDEVASNVPMSSKVTVDSTRAWLDRVKATPLERMDFVLEGRGGQALVMCGITNIDFDAKRGELYMFSNPHLQGKGHGTIALTKLCEWAFKVRELNRIFLYTMQGNERARRFYERGGFMPEGILRSHMRHDGQIVDRHVHGLLKSDWLQRIDICG